MTTVTDVRVSGWALAADERYVELSSAYERKGGERDKTVEHELEHAAFIIRKHSSPVGWWYGREIEQAWSNLHEAEVRLVDLRPRNELKVAAAEALCHGKALKTTDPRLVELKKAVAAREPLRMRAAMRSVLRAAHERRDQRSKDARAFRNRLVILSALVLLALVGIIVLQSRIDTRFVPAPTENANMGALPLLAVVMVFGSIGGLISAIPSVARIPRDRSPFNVPLQQSVLKIVLGALTAVIGVAIVSNSTVSDTMPALVALAAAFGAGQQAVTASVDKRAVAVLDNIPH
jgi:hypothetical protein